MTIDVGYAHVALPDGSVVDFVDVPGHDRLVGNMLVGAGEIDAALLVVAADDGPNAQTLEHLGLLDALGIRDGLAVVTKADLVDEARLAVGRGRGPRPCSRRRRSPGSPVLAASATNGTGIDGVRAAVAALARRLGARDAGRGGAWAAPRDRPRVRGQGSRDRGDRQPARRGGDDRDDAAARARRRWRHASARSRSAGRRSTAVAGGRTALLVGGIEGDRLRRGQVLTTDPGVVATSRILVAMRGPATAPGRAPGRPRAPAPPPGHRAGRGAGGARAARGDRPRRWDLDRDPAPRRGRSPPRPGDRFALRRPSPGAVAGGGVVLDPSPPRGVSRRRLTPERAAALAARARSASEPARLDLHGALRAGPGWRLAPDVDAALRARALALVAAHHAAHPDGRPAASGAARGRRPRGPPPRDARVATPRRPWPTPSSTDCVAGGELARDGDRIRDAGRASGPRPQTLEAMDRLEAALSVAAPPGLADAARAAGCPPDGVRALESPPGGSSGSRTTSPGRRRRIATWSGAPCRWRPARRSRRPPSATRPAPAAGT